MHKICAINTKLTTIQIFEENPQKGLSKDICHYGFFSFLAILPALGIMSTTMMTTVM